MDDSSGAVERQDYDADGVVWTARRCAQGACCIDIHLCPEKGTTGRRRLRCEQRRQVILRSSFTATTSSDWTGATALHFSVSPFSSVRRWQSIDAGHHHVCTVYATSANHHHHHPSIMARYRRLSLAVLLAVCLLLFHHSVGQARASKDGIGAHRVLDRGMQIIRRSSSGKRAPSTASALASYGGHGKASLVRRQQFITDEDRANPVQAAKDVQAIPFLAGNASGITDTAHQLVPGDSDEGQLPWNNGTVPFIATPDTTASAAGGWQAIPDLQGFTLNRSWEVVPGAVMPFYITAGVDPTQVKRAVITFPGKPRDSWKYANLYRNALSVVYANETYGVTNNSVLIVSPVWMNEIDQQAGGVQGKEVYFHGSEWEAGGASRGPNLTHSLTTYGLMDNFTDMLFDTNQYPNLNQVVVAGHSMGGQAAHRYAVLKKQKKYDDNMSFWVGNPG